MSNSMPKRLGIPNGFRVYIAARFSRRQEANWLANQLKVAGCEIASRWVLPDCDHILATGLSAQAEDSERRRFAIEDIQDLKRANWLVSLQEEPRSNGRGGRHVEFGYAVAAGIPITVTGPRETVFHHLPGLEHYETKEQFLADLWRGGAR